MKYIIIMHGHPLSGKSVRAKRIKGALEKLNIKSEIIKSVATRYKDKTRQILFTRDHVDESLSTTKKDKDAAYAAMIPLAEKVLNDGGIPIMDATHHMRYRRQWVYNFAEKIGARVIIIDLTYTDESMIKVELKKREENKDMRENILHKFDQYEMMVKQDELITDEETRQSNVHLIRFDRDKDCLELDDEFDEEPLKKVILDSIKNF